MVMNVNQTQCDDNFTIYTNIESLCCIPENDIMLYVTYTSFKKKKEKNSDSQLGAILPLGAPGNV